MWKGLLSKLSESTWSGATCLQVEEGLRAGQARVTMLLVPLLHWLKVHVFQKGAELLVHGEL